jgi:hypothetical protein
MHRVYAQVERVLLIVVMMQTFTAAKYSYHSGGNFKNCRCEVVGESKKNRAS